MRNLFWRPLVGLTMVSLCCSGLAWGQDDDDAVYGEHLLPPTTRLLFSIPNVADLKERVQASPLGQMLADPDFQPFLKQFDDKIAEASKKIQDETGVSLEDLGNLVQGEFTFAVVEAPARKLNALVMLDYGDQEATIDKLLEKLDEALKNAGAEHSTQSVGDVEVNIFEFPKTNDLPYNKVAYFSTDGYFAVASDIAPLKAVLDRWDGDSDETLANNEVFAYIFEQCATADEEPSVKWYLDLIGLLKSGVSMVQGQNPQAGLVLGVLPILGLDQLKGIGGGMDVGVGDFDSVSKTFIYAEQPPSGLLGVFQFPAVVQQPAKWVGSETTMFMEMNWDVSAAYLAIESVLDSFQGPGATGKLLDGVAMQDDGPQVHPKKDFIDNITGRMTLMMGAAEAEDDDIPAAPEFTLAVGLKNPDGMKATLEKASKSDGFPGRVQEIEGHTVYEIPTAEEQTIYVGVIGEQVVISSSIAGVEAVIAGAADEPLSASEDFQALAAHFPRETSMISFSQQDTQMKPAYEILRKQASEDFQGIDFSLLPEFEALLKYAKPTASYIVPDKKGGLFVGFTLADE